MSTVDAKMGFQYDLEYAELREKNNMAEQKVTPEDLKFLEEVVKLCV